MERKLIASFLVVTLLGSMFAMGAVSAQEIDTQLPDDHVDVDELEIELTNVTATDTLVVYDESDNQVDEVQLDDDQESAIVNTSDVTGEVTIALEDEGTEVMNTSTTLHDVSLTLEDQEFEGDEDEIEVDVDVDGDYHVVLSDDEGEELGTVAVSADDESATVTVESLDVEESHNVTATLYTDADGEQDSEVVDAEDTAEFTPIDDGGANTATSLALPVVGDVPILYLGLGILGVAGVIGAAGYYRMEVDADREYID